jgi:nitrite reductase (NADH) large subunit
MVSGHAYGKSLRTVKTCVGRMVPLWHAGFHRAWHQDRADDLGQLDAHKFKIAVSGCPRNCAEATIKDFGVICVDSGYELHVGGNGGIHLRGTDLLCKVTTEQEALDVRRLHPALPRTGLVSGTHRAMDRARRARSREGALFDDPMPWPLAARFRYSQQFMQDDPGRAAPPARMPNCTSRFRPFPLRKETN